MPEADLIGLFAVPLGKAGLPYMVTGATAANCIHGYPRDEGDATVSTDVYSFHADRAAAAC